MSVSAGLAGTPPRLGRRTQRLLVAALVLAAAAAVLALLGSSLGALVGSAAPAAKNPFGTGLREAAPSATGLGGWILAVQSQFYRSLTGALAAAKQDSGAVWGLVSIGFLYGVFHAAGPGHGKGVIAGYLLATRRTLIKGLGLSLAAALVQAGVAIALVGIAASLLHASAQGINASAGAIETASFGALVAVGLALLWRKSAAVVPGRDGASPAAEAHSHEHGIHGHESHSHRGHHHHHGHGHAHSHAGACDASCGHTHMPAPAEIERARSLRESAGIVLAAGIRPCSGAIILLVFALSQGVFAIGVLATLAMGLGTAITTGALAAIAVLAKGAAMRLANGRGEGGVRLVAWLELFAAGLVTALGGALLLGSWSTVGLS